MEKNIKKVKELWFSLTPPYGMFQESDGTVSSQRIMIDRYQKYVANPLSYGIFALIGVFQYTGKLDATFFGMMLFFYVVLHTGWIAPKLMSKQLESGSMMNDVLNQARAGKTEIIEKEIIIEKK